MASPTDGEVNEATKILAEKFKGKGDSDSSTKKGEGCVAQIPYGMGLAGGAVALLAGYLV